MGSMRFKLTTEWRSPLPSKFHISNTSFVVPAKWHSGRGICKLIEYYEPEFVADKALKHPLVF